MLLVLWFERFEAVPTLYSWGETCKHKTRHNKIELFILLREKQIHWCYILQISLDHTRTRTIPTHTGNVIAHVCTVITYIHITLHIRNPYRQLPQRTSSPLVEPLMPWPLCGSNCCKHSIDPHACNGVTSGRQVIRRGGSLVDNLSINLTPPPSQTNVCHGLNIANFLLICLMIVAILEQERKWFWNWAQKAWQTGIR